MAEFKQENSIITDTMDKMRVSKYGITCCGLMQMKMHIDGTDFYESTWQCECGNVIKVRTKREETW